jgi:hypothetical protein
MAPRTSTKTTVVAETPEVEAPKVEAPAAPVEAPKARAAQKLLWKKLEDADDDGNAPAIGVRNGNTYEIARLEDGSWEATHQVGEGDVTVIATGVSGKLAWKKCVDHHNANYIAPVIETETAETEVA